MGHWSVKCQRSRQGRSGGWVHWSGSTKNWVHQDTQNQNTQNQIHKTKYTNQIHKHKTKYTNAKPNAQTQKQIHKTKYTNTKPNTQTQSPSNKVLALPCTISYISRSVLPWHLPVPGFTQAAAANGGANSVLTFNEILRSFFLRELRKFWPF